MKIRVSDYMVSPEHHAQSVDIALLTYTQAMGPLPNGSSHLYLLLGGLLAMVLEKDGPAVTKHMLGVIVDKWSEGITGDVIELPEIPKSS